MIKVNLGRTRLESLEAIEASGGSDSAMGSDFKDIAIKILIIIAGVVGLKYYEDQKLEGLNAQVAQVNAELFTLQSTLQQKTETLSGLGSIEQDSKVLKDKLHLLKTLSRLRLREVKSLDYIQSVVPQKVWLQSLEIQGEALNVKGVGMDEKDISLFVQRLESGGYFSDVVLIQDSLVNANGVLRREFEIAARIEVVN